MKTRCGGGSQGTPALAPLRQPCPLRPSPSLLPAHHLTSLLPLSLSALPSTSPAPAPRGPQGPACVREPPTWAGACHGPWQRKAPPAVLRHSLPHTRTRSSPRGCSGLTGRGDASRLPHAFARARDPPRRRPRRGPLLYAPPLMGVRQRDFSASCFRGHHSPGAVPLCPGIDGGREGVTGPGAAASGPSVCNVNQRGAQGSRGPTAERAGRGCAGSAPPGDRPRRPFVVLSS